MNASIANRPVTLYVLLALLVFLGLGGVAGGAGMLMDPSGEGMGLPPDLLAPVGLDSFLLPGLFLLTVLGVAPLFTAYGVWARPAWPVLQRLTPWKDLHWSWTWTRIIAVADILLVGLEFLLWGNESPLQVIFLAVGLALLVMGGYPSIRGHLWVGPVEVFYTEPATDAYAEDTTDNE